MLPPCKGLFSEGPEGGSQNSLLRVPVPFLQRGDLVEIPGIYTGVLSDIVRRKEKEKLERKVLLLLSLPHGFQLVSSLIF